MDTVMLNAYYLALLAVSISSLKLSPPIINTHLSAFFTVNNYSYRID